MIALAVCLFLLVMIGIAFVTTPKERQKELREKVRKGLAL